MTKAPRPAVTRLGIGLLSIAGAWLFLGAMPVLADGGPHVASVSSGASTLTTDTCSQCHRAHTAKGEYLITQSTEEALCTSCHGTAAAGATTDVADGTQYTIAGDGTRGGAVAGALRSGGFVQARIASAYPSRINYPAFGLNGWWATFSELVPVLAAGENVTSAHLKLAGVAGVTATNTAWGNGAIGSGAGPVVTMECTSCHDPHGNGQYRILRTIPTAANTSTTGTAFVPAPNPVAVTDAALPSGSGASGVRNYTVQNGRTLQDVITANLGPTAGDYWRRYFPWNGVPTWSNGFHPATGTAGDLPMYVQGGSNLTSFNIQIETWCSACHTRYHATGRSWVNTSGDPIYTYRHTTAVACTQCHVAHGSNAAMSGASSSSVNYPDDTPTTPHVSASSRLLKLNNRGTCQACHDPTLTTKYTDPAVTIVTPTPTPSP